MTEDQFFAWHLGLLGFEARTCRRGHDLDAHGRWTKTHGKLYERCGKCQDIAIEAYRRRRQVA